MFEPVGSTSQVASPASGLTANASPARAATHSAAAVAPPANPLPNGPAQHSTSGGQDRAAVATLFDHWAEPTQGSNQTESPQGLARSPMLQTMTAGVANFASDDKCSAQFGVPGRTPGGAGQQPAKSTPAAALRHRVEQTTGADLQGVRVHTDPAANQQAAALNARAFARGQDIYFASGEYRPGTPEGDHLLAHELVHTIQHQQAGAKPALPKALAGAGDAQSAPKEEHAAEDGSHAPTQCKGSISQAGDPAESEADLIADKVLGGAGPHSPVTQTASGINRAGGSSSLLDFYTAVAAKDVAKAKVEWAKVGSKTKKQLGVMGALQAMDGLGTEALPIMKEAGVGFSQDAGLTRKVLDQAAPGDWITGLQSSSLWSPFLKAEPRRGHLDGKLVKALGNYVVAAPTDHDAVALFEKAYPQLQDRTYGPTFLKTTAWTKDVVGRLYSALAGFLPINHVQAVAKGFYLGTQENLDGKGWNPLGFGWYGQGHVVLPQSSSVSSGGGQAHDMTGGTASGVPTAGTAVDPNLTHWDGTILHEIGHAVADQTDGNSFAKKHGKWKKISSADTWSKHLFDDKAAEASITAKPAKSLSGKEARLFMAKDLAHPGSYVPKGWTATEVMAFLDTYYTGQPLYIYWNNIRRNGNNEYNGVSNSNAVGDTVYAWLSRFDSSYCTYDKAIYDTRVSWYSVSSPAEWFAEQYANYYRTNKSGAGLDADTKAKLDSIDKMEANGGAGKLTKAKGSESSTVPSPGSEATGSHASDGLSETAGSSTRDPGADAQRPQIQRLPFPW